MATLTVTEECIYHFQRTGFRATQTLGAVILPWKMKNSTELISQEVNQ